MDALLFLLLPMMVVCIPTFVLARLAIYGLTKMNAVGAVELIEQLQPVNFLVQVIFPVVVLLIFNYTSGNFASEPAGKIIFIGLLALYALSLAIHSDKGPYIAWKIFFFLFNFFVSLWISVVLLFSDFDSQNLFG